MTKELISNVEEIVKPIIIGLGYELYYIEYILEEGEMYLRIYIDNENGIALSDCEKVSRSISPVLDEKDPINDKYMLEVSSPGMERVLHNEEHMTKNIGNKVNVNLIKAIDKSLYIEGLLLGFDKDEVELSIEKEKVKIKRENISQINLKGDF